MGTANHVCLALLLSFTLPFAGPSPAAAQDEAGHDLCNQPQVSCPQLVFEGLTYPYPREDGSYLFIDGGVYPYVTATDDLLGDSTVSLPGGTEIAVSDLLAAMGLQDHSGQELVPVVGYGSNPAPSQLSRKFAQEILSDSVVIPVMKGWIEGYDIVWTPFFTNYGALPSTIYPADGVRSDIWVNWLSKADVERMDATEHVSSDWYVRADLSAAAHGFDGPSPSELQVYVSCFGALQVDGVIQSLAAVPARGRTTPAIDSVGALALIQPHVAPDASIVELVRRVVSNAQTRDRYTQALAPFRAFSDHEAFLETKCH